MKLELVVSSLMVFSACTSGEQHDGMGEVLESESLAGETSEESGVKQNNAADAMMREELAGEELKDRSVSGQRSSLPEGSGWVKAGRDSYRFVGSKYPDYIEPKPSEALMKRASPLANIADSASCFDCDGQQVSYTSFDGPTYTLRQYKGKYVRLLLPDSWITGEGALTDDERRLFLDRADMSYQMYKEIIGREPYGSGLTNIAFVTSTCGGVGWGCGQIGSKGVEVVDAAWSLEAFKSEIANGTPTNGVVVHELAHNFDLYWSYLWYNNNGAHGWTRFIDPLMRLYARFNGADAIPEEYLESFLRDTYDVYATEPTANWEDCVRDSLCEDTIGLTAEDAYGGITLRYIALHGVQAMLNALDFMNEYANTNPAPYTAKGKADLHIRMLAEGAGVNLGCYVDEWNWYASSALRSEMNARFGTSNPNCVDMDNDGFTVIQGDCDDNNGSVNPNVTETENGVDDDCNGRVDDFTYIEPQGGDFPNPQPTTQIANIQGTIDPNDSDYFAFNIDSPKTIRVTISSVPDYAGFVFLYDGSSSGSNEWQYCGEGASSTRTYYLNHAGQWRLGVELNAASNPGDYKMTIDEASTLPLDAFGATTAPIAVGDDLQLTVNTEILSWPVVTATPTAIRFWVTGVGVVGTVPYAASASFTWSPENLDDGLYGYSAQLLSGTQPVSDFTPIEYFTLKGSEGGECDESTAIDMGGPGNYVTVDNDACLMVRDAYPFWWGTRTMRLLNSSGSSYPVSLDWENNCAGSSGSATFNGNWQMKSIGPTNDDCATFIKLNGDGAGTITFTYYG